MISRGESPLVTTHWTDTKSPALTGSSPKEIGAICGETAIRTQDKARLEENTKTTCVYLQSPMNRHFFLIFGVQNLENDERAIFVRNSVKRKNRRSRGSEMKVIQTWIFRIFIWIFEDRFCYINSFSNLYLLERIEFEVFYGIKC